MTEILKLTIIGFDSMENREPEYVIEEKYFTSSKTQNAYCYCSAYVRALNCKFTLGYNNEVYPKFEVKRINLENSTDES